MKSKIIIGTRGSELALWQAHYAQNQLIKAGLEVGIKVIHTKGDNFQNLSFNKIEGKGFFTKEIEHALLNGEIDMAVHSFKDLPTQSEPGLCVGACSYRENPFDVLIIHPDAVDMSKPLNLKTNATVGTSASRRKAQLHAIRKDLQLKDIRGNVKTRLEKIGNEVEAVVLAAAGLNRLNIDLKGFHRVILTQTLSVPAAAQGVLAYQIRDNDQEMKKVLRHLHHPEVEMLVNFERSVLNALGGGCQQPIGVYATQNNEQGMQIWACFAENEFDFPIRVFFQSKTLDGLSEQITNRLKSSSKKSVFISRHLTSDSFFLKAMNRRNYTVHAQSLIYLTPLPFSEIPIVDWIFFSSPNAVKFFFDQNPEINPKVRFAAIGRTTAQTIRQYHRVCSFEGEGSDITASARLFGDMNKGSKVLFPCAENSLETVQKVLGQSVTAHNLAVYRNKELEEFELPSCQILIFTSPLNVKSYSKKYLFENAEKIIAIGKTTGAELEKIGCKSYVLPFLPDEISLADVCW